MSNTTTQTTYFKEGVEVKTTTLLEESERLSSLETGNPGINTTATYDSATNKYILQRGNAQVSLYSTDTLLEYYFGDNLETVIANGSLKLVSKSNGYDIIVFENSVIGFGASSEIIEGNDSYEEFTEGLALDLASEYVADYIEENAPLASPGFTTALVGCEIFSKLDGDSEEILTIDETKALELVKSLTGFMDYVHGKVAEVIIDDYTSAILSNSNVYSLTEMGADFAVGKLASYDAGFTGEESYIPYSAGVLHAITFDENELMSIIKSNKYFLELESVKREYVTGGDIETVPEASPTDATLTGTNANDGLGNTGETRNMTIMGFAGNDIIYGGSGDDKLYGGSGDDYINSQGGNNTIFGEYGNDILYVGEGNDVIYGGYGDDIIFCELIWQLAV